MPERPFPLMLATILFFLSAAALRSQTLPRPMTKRIDSIFADFNASGSPGCAIAVYRDGRIVYARGYGLASIEHNVPITPATAFQIGSTSKQFTAACIVLLAEDGTLSLDDDVRKYIPELPDYGHTITIRDLLIHASGIRVYVQMLAGSGFDPEDVVTSNDVMRAIARQRGLNFEPGTQYLYSNSGYFLAGEIVKRASGMPFSAFAAQRIFKPLGMKHTAFVDDHTAVIANGAEGYAPADSGFARDATNWDAMGATGVTTTVEDLAIWDENFYHPRVGDEKMVTMLLERGVLTNGDTLDDALGLEHGTLRGVAIVSHSGATRGFTSDLIRVPSEHLSVAVLSNIANTNSTGLARKVLTLLLEDKLPKAPQIRPAAVPHYKEVPIDTATFDAYDGTYALDEAPEFQIRISRDGTHFYSRATGQRSLEIFPSSDSTFFLKVIDATITFHRGNEGKAGSLTLVQGSAHRATRVEPFTLAPNVLNDYIGEYHSPDLESTFTLSVTGGKLVAAHQRLDTALLTPTHPDIFTSDAWYLRDVAFERGADGHVTAMVVSMGRTNNVRFDRKR